MGLRGLGQTKSLLPHVPPKQAERPTNKEMMISEAPKVAVVAPRMEIALHSEEEEPNWEPDDADVVPRDVVVPPPREVVPPPPPSRDLGEPERKRPKLEPVVVEPRSAEPTSVKALVSQLQQRLTSAQGDGDDEDVLAAMEMMHRMVLERKRADLNRQLQGFDAGQLARLKEELVALQDSLQTKCAEREGLERDGQILQQALDKRGLQDEYQARCLWKKYRLLEEALGVSGRSSPPSAASSHPLVSEFVRRTRSHFSEAVQSLESLR
jgi:hypothetical protein